MDLYKHYHAYGGRGPTCVRVGLSLGTLATILIILRIYVRLRINRTGTTALLWAIATWILSVTTEVFTILAALHGLGNHMTVIIEEGQAQNFLKFTWLTVFFFHIGIPTGKTAVAVFLMEIIGLAYVKMRWILMSIAAMNYLISVPIAIYSQLHCNPINALWNPLKQQQCNTHMYVLLSYVSGSIAALSDILLALLPIYILWSLQIDRKLKQVLCVLLSLGIVAAIAAIVRTWATSFLEGEDASYHLGILFEWGQVEGWLVLIAMSVPPTWPLVKPYYERFGLVSSRNSSRTTGKTP
ncbi:hypothetical protein EV356DRAFT_437826, partial [Viridothelium virens]